MRLLRSRGLESLAWSLRRLHCPVDAGALVLEVGSGGNPYFRANVLLDAFEETRQRHWAPLVADRPTVIGFAENLPFRDKAFDFVIAAHVLEHSDDPDRFLGELQRVARAGYIEVPDAFMERVNPYLDHRLEITSRSGRLIIRKKQAWQTDPELVELYEDRAKSIIADESIPRHPFSFHVRYFWEGKIDYVVENPDTDAGWTAAATTTPSTAAMGFRQTVNRTVLHLLRKLLSQNRRNRSIDLTKLLRCPACHSERLQQSQNSSAALECLECKAAFPVSNGIPQFTGPARPLVGEIH